MHHFLQPGIASVLFSAVALAFHPWTALAAVNGGTLDIYWVDSEGGGSTLIVTPAGESVLFDTGNPGGRDSGRILKVASEVAGLTRLDHVIITHFHIDHFGGAAELESKLPIRNLWDNGVPDGDPDGRRESNWPLVSKSYRGMSPEARHVVQPGTTIPFSAGTTPIELRCYAARQEVWTPPRGVRPPPQNAGPPANKPRDTSDNANSSAWVLSFGSFRFFDGGDLSWNSEAALVWPQVLVPEVDVFQVNHHGLDVSNHPRLLQALNPTVSVMNNGPTKGTMTEVMNTLRTLPLLKAQYQIHKNLRDDGRTNNCPDEFIANIPKECAAHYLHCSVDSKGVSYTMAIAGQDHRRTYPTRERTVPVP